ncbi:MAG: LysR family transcriptional regulator [Betaproteobacteria bacterium]|nr:LysR family transcriptional regulator [Betaproteobacteria bacterium]
MNLHRLRQFIVVAEELHFGRAARRLRQTQPPLSMALQALERELGVRLLERTRRQVSLTPAGVVFLEEARGIMERTARAVESARAAHRGEVGKITVGFLAATAYTLLPVVVRDFVARFPGVRLDLRELTMSQQFEAFRHEDIDVGLLRPLATDVALDFETIMEEPMVVALPAGHPLSRLKRISGAKLARESFVMFPRTSGTIFHDLIINFCRDAGFVPRISQEATQTHAVLGLVSAGLGVALVPDSVRIIGMRGVVFRALAANPPIVPTAVAWRTGNESPLVRGFLDTARDCVRGLGRR